MTASVPLTLDVREELRHGGEPLPRIMETVKQLAPGQALRLLATFEPLPLYAVLGRKGFSHQATYRGVDDWEVVFTPGSADPQAAKSMKRQKTASISTDDWPTPSAFLDNRGLEPPEPMVRILNSLEHLAPGEVLEAINERDPVFLYPELEARGAAIHTDKNGDGVYLLIRRGI